MKNDELFLKDNVALRDLKTLEEVEKNPNLSQRALASSLDVALGVANACIHTLVRKGMIKIRGDNNRSITYHLTKKGLLHKSMLAMEWTKNTISFYREARQQVVSKLTSLSNKGIKTIVLYGANELSEIAAIVASEANIEILGIINNDDSYIKKSLLGIPIGGMELIKDKKLDAIVVCVESTDRVCRQAGKEMEKLADYIKGKGFKAKICKLIE